MAIGNPVDAFARGFAVVDQLETNRQLRSFREEQQSRLRKEWAHQDEEWAREANERRQAKYAAAFESTTVSVMEEVDMQVQEQLRLADEADAAGRHDEAKKRRKHADEAIKYWTSPNPVIDGRPAGEAMIVQEVVRRMQQADPEFGEWVMLQAGRDPGAGSLVNSMQPVQSLVVVPPELSPLGIPSIAAELNRKDGGTGGMTQFRTDRPNDPIDFVPVTSSLAHKVFGPAYATGNSAALRLLRNTLEEPAGSTARTDPSRPVTGASAEQAAGAGGGDKEQTGSFVPLEEIEVEEKQRTPDILPPVSHFQPAVPPSEAGGTAPTSSLRDRTRAQGDRGPAMATTPTATIGSQGMNPASEPEQSFLPEGMYEETIAPGLRFLAEPFAPVGRAIGRTLEAGKQIATTPKTVAESLSAEGPTIPEGQRQGTVMDSPVVKAIGWLAYGSDWKPSPAEADVSPKDVKAGAQEGNQAAQEKIGAPSDDRQAMQAAQVVTQPVRGRRPSWLQQYSAIGLKNLGVINEEQLMRYAKTGSFDPEAEEKVVNLGDGRLFVYDEGSARQGTMMDFGTRPDPDAALETQSKLIDLRRKNRALIEDTVKWNFMDEDGEVDNQAMGDFLTVLTDGYTVMGLDDNTLPNLLGRSSDANLNSMARAWKLLRQYDPDLAQNILEGTGDFNPWPGSDPVMRWNGGNLALGLVADTANISSGKDAAEFYTEYGAELRNAPQFEGLPARQYIKTVAGHEALVQQMTVAAKNPNSKFFKDAKAKFPWYKEGMDRNAIRREYVEWLIENPPQE